MKIQNRTLKSILLPYVENNVSYGLEIHPSQIAEFADTVFIDPNEFVIHPGLVVIVPPVPTPRVPGVIREFTVDSEEEHLSLHLEYTLQWGDAVVRQDLTTRWIFVGTLPNVLSHWSEINYLLVLYGQHTCKPRNPHCNECKINDCLSRKDYNN